jgi:D-alanine-D-alanine ligase
MDKAVMKSLFAERGLPMVRHITVYARDWRDDRAGVLARSEALGYPLFVKPANLGSSVGISKVRDADGLTPAIETAFTFDRKLVIEAGVAAAREIECAVLGNDDPRPRSGRDHRHAPRRLLFYDAKHAMPADRRGGFLPICRRRSRAGFRP